MRISVPNPAGAGRTRIKQPRNDKKTFTLIELIVVVVVLGVIAALAVGTFQTVSGSSAENIALQSAEQVVRNAENIGAFQGEELSGAIGNSNIDLAGSEINETSGAQYYSSIGESYAGKVIVYENGECAGAIIGNDDSINVTECSWEPFKTLGGDKVYDIDVNGVTYRVHEFTTVGESSFTVTDPGANTELDYLVVGGGGAGSANAGGGGGAGGLLSDLAGNAQVSLISGDYTIFVGNGGVPGSGGRASESSSISGGGVSLVAYGGGAGGWANGGGQNGGSGGGHGRITNSLNYSSGKGTPGQGNDGGPTGINSPEARGAGGGGAVGPGRSPLDEVDRGGGGAAVLLDITGEERAYAGGGGGGYWTGPVSLGGSAGGLRSGGDGGWRHNFKGQSGVDGTGGGGGQRGTDSSVGGNGGSGIVIIRYQISP